MPADSCKEIKAGAGGQAVSGKYWLDSIVPGKAILIHCDMETEGKHCHDNQLSRQQTYWWPKKCPRKGVNVDSMLRMKKNCGGERLYKVFLLDTVFNFLKACLKSLLNNLGGFFDRGQCLTA